MCKLLQDDDVSANQRPRIAIYAGVAQPKAISEQGGAGFRDWIGALNDALVNLGYLVVAEAIR